jgi:carnitine O-acetyltransferase
VSLADLAVAKQSPDAYIQQALQLAWYRDQGYATATYETASTRTLSDESRNFVKSMVDPKVDVSSNCRHAHHNRR